MLTQSSRHLLAREIEAESSRPREMATQGFMHPVLKISLEPLGAMIEDLTQEEAQIAPLPGQGRWSAQQVIEHLILTYKLTSDTVGRHLKSGRAARKGRRLLLSFLRLQTIGLGRMPRGVPAIHAVRPERVTPMDGPALRGRFLEAVEEMDELLGAARKKFGIQPCGEHPFYGGLRVDEWRRYHAVHARHHRKQLEEAIRNARSGKAGGAA
jgi:hypothetical protein